MLFGIDKAVFFGAHTDDEFIAAGTLHRLVRQGCEVHVVSFSPAAIEYDRCGGEMSARTLEPEWNRSLDAISIDFDRRHFLKMLPSVNLPNHSQQICQYIYDFCEKHRPTAVFTLSPDDENTAHAVVGREAERVTRGRVPIHIRCHYPWNYSIGRSNMFVRLDEACLNVKRYVIDAYQSQCFRYNYREMLLAYCQADGLSVKAGWAEKFEVIRSVV